MNWDSIIKAYPSQADVILGIKSLRERIERAMDGISIPEISVPCRDMENLSQFIPLITPVCVMVWKEFNGSDPTFDMDGILRAATGEQGIPEIDGTEGELIGAIINNTFSRFLHLLREKNTHVIPESWNQGDCPFCGAYARIGFDAEDKRELHCLTCGHCWRFARLRCFSCSNADFNTLGYFEVEGLEGVRVCFCRECNHYFKVIDTRVKPAADPETEDALTLELDDLAVKEGFV